MTELERIPPHSIEAECAVLGTMIISTKAIRLASEQLKAGSFYNSAHGTIFEAIVDLFRFEGHVDLITLPEYLKGIGKLSEVGGLLFITKLATEESVTGTGVRQYVKIVRSYAVARYLIDRCRMAVVDLYERGNALKLAEEIQVACRKALREEGRSDFSGMNEIVPDVRRAFEAAKESDREWAGLDCGFKKINDKLNGLCQAELTILAARPSIGKTRLAMQMAKNVAINEGEAVGIFSLEMSKRQLGQYMVCAEAGVDLNRFRAGKVDMVEQQKLVEAEAKVSRLPIHIDDTTALTIPKLIAGTERLMDKANVKLIVIDYLQLMAGPGDGGNEKFDLISQGLKNFSKEFNIPVLCLSQLNRAVEARPDKRPHIGDLRDSGAIEQNAVNVLLIYRPGHYEELMEKCKNDHDAAALERQADILAEKTRFGPTGTIRLAWNSANASFEN